MEQNSTNANLRSALMYTLRMGALTGRSTQMLYTRSAKKRSISASVASPRLPTYSRRPLRRRCFTASVMPASASPDGLTSQPVGPRRTKRRRGGGEGPLLRGRAG